MDFSAAKRIFIEIARSSVLASKATDSFPSGPINDPLLIRRGLVLHGEIVNEYNRALDKLAQLAGKTGSWSKDSIDDLLSRRLEAVLLSEVEGSARINNEADIFTSELSQTPHLFHVAISVFGLDIGLDGTSFGNIKFRAGSYSSRRAIPSLVLANQELPLLYADMSVQAIDAKTAEEHAKSALERHLSIFNALFSDGSPSHVKVAQHYVPAQAYSFVDIKKDTESEPSRHCQGTRKSIPLSKSEYERKFQLRGVARVSALLQSRNTLQIVFYQLWK